MKLKRFGGTEILASELGLGCARIGGIFQNDAAAFVRLLQTARSEGINFFDTADMYSQGESEALIGRAFHRQRHNVVIASKVGYCLPAQRRWIARIKPVIRPLIKALKLRRDKLPGALRGKLQQNFSPEYIRLAVEGSLRRLKTDYLDILQLHSPEANVVKRGDWLEGLDGLKQAGKIRFYGISCDTVEAATAALEYASVASLQLAINLLDKRFEQTVLRSAKAPHKAVIARECLANGVLIKHPSEIFPAKYWTDPSEAREKLATLQAFRAEAETMSVPIGRLALNYVTGLDGVSVTLIGVSSHSQLLDTLTLYRT